MRRDGRSPDEARPVFLECGFLKYAEGSCLATAGGTRIVCAASFERRVPRFLVGSGQGWVTAEYGLLPRSTLERTPRETAGMRGRTQEIRRFLGRCLRAVCDLSALGERQIVVDCDVIDADGGTRTLGLTGGLCALRQAVTVLLEQGEIERDPVIEPVAAMSCGLVAGEALVDLSYEEDARADADMNVVLTESGRIVEVQCAAERIPLSRAQFEGLLESAAQAIGQLFPLQRAALARSQRGLNSEIDCREGHEVRAEGREPDVHTFLRASRGPMSGSGKGEDGTAI